MAERIMSLLEQMCAEQVYETIQYGASDTDRTRQSEAHRMGVSNLGHCRQYAKLMTEETPFSDEVPKQAAFIGTVLGQAVEAELAKHHPDWEFQGLTVFRSKEVPGIDGHTDVVIPAEAGVTEEEALATAHLPFMERLFPQGVWDLKSKAELDTIRRYGQSQQQRYQLHAYAKAKIDDGTLDPDQPIWLVDVYFDRSGRSTECFAIGMWYDPAVIDEIDDWVHDVKYAVINQEDASRDMPREFCWKYCEFATVCRGNDTDVEGLVDDPDFRAAVETYQDAADMEREGKRLKESVKIALDGRKGVTPDGWQVRQTWINPTRVEAFDKAGYWKTEVRPVPNAKPKSKPRPRAKAKEQ